MSPRIACRVIPPKLFRPWVVGHWSERTERRYLRIVVSRLNHAQAGKLASWQVGQFVLLVRRDVSIFGQ